jgi:hypothetical protein
MIPVRAVGTVTWIVAGESAVRIPAWARNVSLLQNVQICRVVKLTIHRHPVPRLRMSGAIPLLSLYAFMAKALSLT